MKTAALFFSVLILTGTAHADDVGGTTFQDLTDRIQIFTVQTEKVNNELAEKKAQREALKQQIARQIEEAKAKSAEVLSKEELAKIKAQADAVLEKARRELERLEAEIKSIEDAGAMVFCSSVIIEEVKP